MVHRATMNVDDVVYVDAAYVDAVIEAAGHTRKTFEGPFLFPENTHEIDEDAFKDCFKLKKVTLPNTVTYIGHSAFHGCQSLQSFVMPNSVMRVGFALFAWCVKLELVILSKRLPHLGAGMFSHCSSLKSIVIPENVPSIPARTFENCGSLKAINFLGPIDSLGDRAFENTSVEFIVAPKSLFFGQISFQWYNFKKGDIDKKKINFASVFESSLKLAVLNDEDTGNSEVILFNSKPPSFLPSTISKTGIAKALTVRSFVYPPINAWQQWLNLSRKLFPSLPDELRLIIIGFINGKSTGEFNAILNTFDVSRAITSSGALYDHTV